MASEHFHLTLFEKEFNLETSARGLIGCKVGPRSRSTGWILQEKLGNHRIKPSNFRLKYCLHVPSISEVFRLNPMVFHRTLIENQTKTIKIWSLFLIIWCACPSPITTVAPNQPLRNKTTHTLVPTSSLP